MITISKEQIKSGGWNQHPAYKLPVEKVEKELEQLQPGQNVPKHIAPRILLMLPEDAKVQFNGESLDRKTLIEQVSYAIPRLLLRLSNTDDKLEHFELHENRTFLYLTGKVS